MSRMRYIAAQMERPVRFLGLSTALANAADLADWLAISKRVGFGVPKGRVAQNLQFPNLGCMACVMQWFCVEPDTAWLCSMAELACKPTPTAANMPYALLVNNCIQGWDRQLSTQGGISAGQSSLGPPGQEPVG